MNSTPKLTEPLTDEEMVIFKAKYTQNFDTMSAKEALNLFRLVRNNSSEMFDPFYHNLLLRRLYMIIDWENYPERLI